MRARFVLPILATFLALPAVAHSSRAGAAGAPHPDFDGDGRGDLVVPVVGETIAGAPGAGAVHVFYGTSSGIVTSGSQLWSQDSDQIRNRTGANDHFGAAWAAADFDRDGFDDLAIGVPGELGGAGAIHVLYGAVSGLGWERNQLFWQNTTGVPGDAAGGDGFGAALAAGDFDHDGKADLAIGAPRDAAPNAARGGTVTVLSGTAAGIGVVAAAQLVQGTDDIVGLAEAGDEFGAALAAGDTDGDGRVDLAVGAPGEDVGATQSSGAVSMIYGTGQGLQGRNSQQLLPGNFGIPGYAEAFDEFGRALTIGQFNRGGSADLVVGSPGEGVGTAPGAGALTVVPGSINGLLLADSVLLTQQSPGVAGALQGSTGFGSVLEHGDFDGDGRDDLVVGMPFFDAGPGRPSTGAIVTLYGGLDLFGGRTGAMITQDTTNVIDVAEALDFFGLALQPVDGNGDGRDGLWVGVPGEDLGTVADAGAGHVFGGSASGLTPTSTTLWSQNTAGIGDSAQTDDFFGGGEPG